MRTICIIGAIVTTLLVGQDVLLENYHLWFDREEYNALASSFNPLFAVSYFGIFSVY
ncbi:MAG: hypothetical protein P8I55_08475 [Crocinitomix sp.]|nr:hypothetical protein [Crocinitomix sp.]